MANAYTDTLVNYTGELLEVGNNETPILNMVGGLSGIRAVSTNEFSCAQTWTPGAGAQTALTEVASVSAPTEFITRAQEKNVVQIMQYGWNISYSKEGNIGQVSAVSNVDGVQPITDERAFQESAYLGQMQKDLSYTMLKGLYAGDVNSATARKSRGLTTAVTTNAVDAGAVALSKVLIDSMLLTGAEGGVKFGASTITLAGSALTIEKINGWYGVQERSNDVGGTYLKVIATPFGYVNLVFDPSLADTDLLLIDVGQLGVVGKNIPGKGIVFSEALASVGASVRGQLFGELGIDYNSEKLHAKLYNFTNA